MTTVTDELDLDVHLPAIAAGDSDAFGSWLAAAEPSLRGSLRRFAATVDTEAVLQEALLRLWQVAPRVAHDGRPNSLLRLGFVIARNLAVSETRRQAGRATEPLQLTETIPAAAPAPPDPLLRQVIADCHDKLPNKPAQALTERINSAGAEPDATLAARIGMRTNTFLQNIARARRLLADCLGRHGVVGMKGELA